jgi:hypothetical protein
MIYSLVIQWPGWPYFRSRTTALFHDREEFTVRADYKAFVIMKCLALVSYE